MGNVKQSAGFAETVSFHVVDFIAGWRKVFALIVCAALLCASMYFNGSYGWMMADTIVGKYTMATLYASLDASLMYLSCMCIVMTKEYGKCWLSIYAWCAVLALCSIFTCVSFFSANSVQASTKKSSAVNDAIISAATISINLSSESVNDWNEKLKTTHNNTTSWNDQKQVESNRIDDSLSALLEVKRTTDDQVSASDAVFKDLGIEKYKGNIRTIFGIVIGITGVLMAIVLNRDKVLTSTRIETKPRKTMKPKGKTESQSRKPTKTVKKNATSIRDHKDFERIKQAVLKRDLKSPVKSELVKFSIGGTTAGAMLKEFEKDGLVVLGNRGYEYPKNKMRAV